MTEISGQIKLHASWLAKVGSEFEQPYMKQLKQFLVAEKRAGKTLFPSGDNIFNALNTTPFESVKVVILGQDPYHGPGQAHGLCFSVLPGVPFPPSLQNIFKELQTDLQLAAPNHGCLQSWAEQGVLLLNATLSVEQGRAGSHQNKGWETFTDAVVNCLNNHRENLVFMLWGSYAQRKGAYIDTQRHCVLKAPHPSPLSSHRGFFGCQHFSKANAYLQAKGIAPVDWRIDNL
ncbi:uracil-DNA glycosylase [Alteromonadaceae bacterium 2753L.S.0a.02]|nr:uracil-DNA glycosylase [Alteromonadaceae bacterium 2753L.S.0a.02]